MELKSEIREHPQAGTRKSEIGKAVLVARGVKKSFRKDGARIDVLRGVDLAVRPGDFITIMGPSGAGKTTFLHILGSLDHATEGEILYRERRIQEYNEAELARFRNEKVGFVFQFYHLLQDFTVMENIMMPLWIRGERSINVERTAEEFLEIIGLRHRRNHKPGELSGGEQQRVAIARALVNRPEIILADEPTGNLDRKTGTEVMEYILSIHRRTASALVLVTHDPEIGSLGTRRITMVDGQLTETASSFSASP